MYPHFWLSKFLFFFFCHTTACRVLVPPSGIEPLHPAVEARSPNHWTAREVPGSVNSCTARVAIPIATLRGILVAGRVLSLPFPIQLPPRSDQPTDSRQLKVPRRGYSSAGGEGLRDGTPTCCRPKGYVLETVFSPLQHCLWSEVPGARGLKRPSRGDSSEDLKPDPILSDHSCPMGWQCPLALALGLLTSNGWRSRQRQLVGANPGTL